MPKAFQPTRRREHHDGVVCCVHGGANDLVLAAVAFTQGWRRLGDEDGAALLTHTASPCHELRSLDVTRPYICSQTVKGDGNLKNRTASHKTRCLVGPLLRYFSNAAFERPVAPHALVAFSAPFVGCTRFCFSCFLGSSIRSLTRWVFSRSSTPSHSRSGLL